MTIYHWKLAVMAIGAFATIAMLYRHRIIHAKIVVAAALLALIALQSLDIRPVPKTPLEIKMGKTEQAIGKVGKEDDDIKDALEKLADARSSKGDINASIVALEEAVKGDTALEDQVKELKADEIIRVENSIDTARAIVAKLNEKKSLTAEDKLMLERAQSIIPKWYDRLPVKLGLDLRGGTEVRLRLMPDNRRLNRKKAELETLRKKTGVTEKEIADKQEEVSLEASALKRNFSDAITVIRRRLNNSGLEEIYVSQQGKNKVLIQLPGMGSAEAEQIIKRVQRLGKLEFRLIVTEKENNVLYKQMMDKNPGKDAHNFDPEELRFLTEEEVTEDEDGIRIGRKSEEPLYDLLYNEKGEPQVVEQVSQITGVHLRSSSHEADPKNAGFFQINLTFTQVGKWIFSKVTEKNLGRQLGIVLDGKLKSHPNLNDVISQGRAVISGNFTGEDANNLSIVLKSGSLGVKIEKEFENTVGPTLGEDSIRSGVQAMLIGLCSVVFFMLIYYWVAGAVTNVALLFNILMVVAMLSLSNAALTLPGIAGLILTVGMAVDANVLIFERIREERRKGNALLRSVELGYERAFVTIVDANVTTFITALILHAFGTEAVKGFAMTLMIGIIASMFTSMIITRWIFEALIDWNVISDLKMFKLFNKPNFNFVKMRRPAMVLSSIVIICGMALVYQRGDENLGQDFTGGARTQLSLGKPIDMAAARKKAKSLNGEVSIQSYGKATDGKFDTFVLRTKDLDLSPENYVKEIAKFKANIADNFPLQAEGLIVNGKLAEFSTLRESAYSINLTMKTARAPKALAAILSQSSLIEPYVVVSSKALPSVPRSQKASISMAVSKKDAKGVKRKTEKQWKAAFVDSFKDIKQDLLNLGKDVVKVTQNTGAINIDLTNISATVNFTKAVTMQEAKTALAGVPGLTITMLELPEIPQMSEEATTRVSVLCKASRRDIQGALRDDSAMVNFIREQFHGLREQGLIDFTDPFPRFTSIGPAVANDMKSTAAMALIFSLVAIFFYIWLRFQFRAAFGIGAILALFHDVLVTISALAVADHFGLLNGQIDLVIVAAILTLVGYSLNDTIVVFDRIRENMHASGHQMAEVINDSINQTLSRTVITSVTTLAVVASLLLLGGEVIRGFAFALFIGVLVGTYSSIFIASPVLVELGDYYHKRQLKKKEKKENKG